MAAYFVNTLNLPVTWDGISLIFATSSGGTPTVANPGSGDTVTIDAASGSGVITVNTNFNITSLTCGAMATTLDFSANNNSPTMQTFNNSGTGTRTFNPGSGTFTITGNSATIVDQTTTTNLTIGTNTAVFNCNYSGATGTRSLNIGTPTSGRLFTIKVSSGTDIVRLLGGTYDNLDFTGFSGSLGTGSTQNIFGFLTTSSNMTVGTFISAINFIATSGTNVITSNGFSWNSAITFNGVGGTWQLANSISTSSSFTLTNGTFNANNFNVTCGSFSSSNSNTRTLTMGSGTWTITGNAATVWSMSNNAGLTYNPGTSTVNFTYSGSTGTRVITSGSSAPFAMPNTTISAGSDIITTTGTWFGTSLIFVGFTGTWGTAALNLSGNLTLGSGMTATAGNNAVTFSGTSGTQSFTSNSVAFDRPVTMNGVGGTLQFADTFVMATPSTHILTLTNGTINANNQNVTVGLFSSSNSNVRTLTMGSGTWTLTGTGTVWDTSTVTNLTLNANTSTIIANDASSSSKTIASGVTTLNNLTLGGAGTGTFIIGTSTGTSTFNNITVSTPPHTVQVFAGKTLVASSLTWSGIPGSLNTFQSTSNGTPWTISVASGSINENYISLQDSTASGATPFYAGANSVDATGNTNWIFTNNPSANSGIGRRNSITNAIMV